MLEFTTQLQKQVAFVNLVFITVGTMYFKLYVLYLYDLYQAQDSEEFIYLFLPQTGSTEFRFLPDC